MNTQKFNEFDLSKEMLDAIADLGYEEATPIQAQTIEVVRQGYDVIGQSQTGTGKTAAFGIPVLETITEERKIQALILCPTRELAIQVCEEFRKLLKYKTGVSVLPIYGGQPIERQIAGLKKGVQVIVGTPGRVMDHMRRHTIKTNNIRTVVLDEADEMLDMGFKEDIETILEGINDDRQIVLFSATMKKAILEIANEFQNEPKIVKVAHKELTVPNIEQVYIELREKNKTEALCRLIDINDPELSIVFCNTKKRVDEVVEALQSRGYFAEGIHGDLKQQQRDIVMKKFRNRTLEVLVATDVAARGIDVENVDLVFNFDLPQDEEYYVHRIGRTGRAGRTGKSYTFIVGREHYKLKELMKYTKSKIHEEKPPTLDVIEEMKSKVFLNKLKDTLAEEEGLKKYIDMLIEFKNETIDEEYATLDIAAALLKLHLYDKDVQDIDFSLDKRRDDKSKNKDRDRDREKGKGRERKVDPNAVRLFVSIGKKDRVTVRDIVGAIANECNISGRDIGSIDLYNEFTFVDVKEEHVNGILKKMNGKKIKGKKIALERAKVSKK